MSLGNKEGEAESERRKKKKNGLILSQAGFKETYLLFVSLLREKYSPILAKIYTMNVPIDLFFSFL